MSETCFLTGSRAYGTPREDSDVDLVMLADESAFQVMAQVSSQIEFFAEGGCSLRFGLLNIIGVTNADEFAKWKSGTEHLKTIAPVTREHAVEYLTGLGLTNQVSG